MVEAILVAAGIPSAVTGLGIWWIQRKIAKQEKTREEKEAAKEENELLLIKLAGASLSLGEATASAVKRIPDARCNGDMEAALQYAKRIKQEHKDLLYENAVKNLV